MLLVIIFTACAQNNVEKPQDVEDNMRIKITVGQNEFTAILYDNETARTLFAMLPLTINMIELNGNEKYYNFPQDLPSGSPQSQGTINTGDLKLWSTNCLVIFYKTFSSNYRYVNIGRIENTNGLEAALGKGNVEVSFSVIN
jgi:hypothetical protein